MVASFPFLTEGAADYEEAEKKRIGQGEPSPVSPISSPAAPVGPTVPRTPESIIPQSEHFPIGYGNKDRPIRHLHYHDG
eukprot:g23410.t1